jgi:ABC-type multidrug transport system ATPase subunit
MFIKSLNISDLGYIQSLEIQFSNNKVNILQGRNNCGKTTILATLYSILQDKEILQYKSEGSKTQLQIEIVEDNCKVKVKKSYVDGRPKLLIDSFDEMKKLLSIRRDRLYLFSGEFIGNKYKLDSDQINNAGNLLNKLEIVDEYTALISTEDNKSYNFMSEGMQAYYWILNLLYHVPQNSVVMIDELFAKLDLHMTENILNIMDKIENVQFILTANLMMDVKRDYNKIVLESKYVHSYRYSVPDFSYRRVFSNSLKVLSALVNDEKRNSYDRHIIKYELGKEIDEVENRSVEFKEIKGNNPCNSIIDNAEIYINSYLNSRVSGIGIIKWGISDEGIIKGVRLSKRDRDTIDKMISEKVGQMKPYVSTEGIHISFEEIISEEKILKELFIVEISVESVDSDILFSTSKSEIYIKTDGGKRKLNPFEIQQELQLRLRL